MLTRLDDVASRIVNAIPCDGKRFVVRADEKLTAFLELERVTRESLRLPNTKVD